jgi:hypothetical protein
LLQRRAANDLPYLLQEGVEPHFLAIRRLYTGILAVDFQRWTDTGEDKVRATYTFSLKALDPIADANWKLSKDRAPVADRRIARTRTANEVDACGERGRVPCAQSAGHFCCDRPRACNGPSSPCHAG